MARKQNPDSSSRPAARRTAAGGKGKAVPAKTPNLAELRRRARKLLADGALRGDPTLAGDPERLLHELAVQHAELLAQSEELIDSQARLESARYRLERIFADSPLGYLVLGPDGVVQEASLRARELFAFPRSMAGLDVGRFLLPQDRARLADALADALAMGARQVLELRFAPHRGRTARDLRLSLSALRPEPGEPPLILAMAEDVTEERLHRQQLLAAKRAVEDEVARRTVDLVAANTRLGREVAERTRTEAALRESEERLRAILGAIQVGVMVVDPRTRKVVSANAAACRLMGRSEAEAVGLPCDQVCPHEPDQCPVLDLGQTVDSSERRHVHVSGRMVPVLKTVTRTVLDGREHLLECFMDLSERRRMEAAFQGVADSASDAIYLYSLNPDFTPGRFVEVNPAACRMLGYSRREFQRLSPPDIRAPEIPPGHFAEIVGRLLHKGRALFETVHVAKDGRRIPVEIHARLLGQENTPVVLSVVRDVTARKAAEAALLRARAEAEAASRTKNEFLANMSHELRTPLNGVMGMLQLLAETPLNMEQHQYAGIAMQSARGMLALVNDLLDLSRIEAGRMTITQESLDVRAVLESVCQVFDEPARAKGLTLRCTIHPGVPDAVLGDPMRLRQVLFNLTGNAVKFTDAGAVRLAVAALPGPAGSGPPRLFFSVADSGMGMSDSQLASVFQPFVQVDGSSSRRYGGAGLGLAITRRLLSLMGGRLSVETAPGQGSEFVFALPLHPARPAPPAPEVPVPTEPGRSLRLLLAEDEPVNRLAAQLMLERLGHQVALAADGEEALSVLARQEFDCVLLDISMPVLDGLAVLRALREREAEAGLPRTPVVAMTAHAMAGDRERFLAEGCDGYLAKPVDLEELTRTLAAMVRPIA